MSDIKSKMSWSAVLLGYFSLFALGLLDNIRSPFFLDISGELKLPDLIAALFFVSTSIFAFITGLFVPYLIGQLRVTPSLRVGLFATAIGFLIISQAASLFLLILGAAVFGIGFGIINVAQNILIMEGANEYWRRRLLSGLHGMYALAALTAPLVASYFFHKQLDWRRAFFFISFVAIAGLLLSFLHNDPVPSERLPTTEPFRFFPAEFKKYFPAGVILSLYIISEVLISTRFPIYLRRVYGFTAEQSSNYLALFFVFLFIGRLVFLIFDFQVSNLRIIKSALSISLFANVLGLVWHPFFLALCGLTMAPIFGLSIDFIANKFAKRANDAVSICVTLSGVFLVLMHYGIGLATQYLGIHTAMYFGCLTLAAAILLIYKYEKG